LDADQAPRVRASVLELHAALAGAHSATEVLERLCGVEVTAERVRESTWQPGDPRRSALALGQAAELRHRRSLLCARGDVLVIADLWYAPAHLPAERVRALTATSQPFGRIMQGLGLTRRLLGFRIGSPGAQTALRHHALLSAPDGTAVAEVVERYRRAALRTEI
jgi:chorismate-pyruvate lyase